MTSDLPPATGHKCLPFKKERCYFDVSTESQSTLFIQYSLQEGSLETDLYHIEEMFAGHTIEGPAILVDKNRFEIIMRISING